jgi:hypothetical protein
MGSNRNKSWTGTFGFIILMVTSVAWAAPVPDTGQTKCYDDGLSVITCPSPGQDLYGQDANYSINPMSYTKLDSGGNELPDSASTWTMVRDNVTGLTWEMKMNKDRVPNYNDPHDADNTYTWYDPTDPYPGTPGNGTDTKDFIDALSNANFGGYSDWRLPTLKELASIVNVENRNNNINGTYFPNTQSSFYWSSTSHAKNLDAIWGLSFDSGSCSAQYAEFSSIVGYVLAVHGGQSNPTFVDNNNGTVTDTSTGLMWQQDTSDYPMIWKDALSYCENSTLAGYTDWRLPTKKELQSLMDFSRYNPAINTMYFPNTASDYYWSSTTGDWNASFAWYVNFGYGFDRFCDKSQNNYVRAVRGGQFVQPTPPIPNIKANGQDGEITVSFGTLVSITTSLVPGDQNGKSADWWIAESTPWGLYSLTSSGWLPEINMLFQYPLVSLSPVEIYIGSLPVGDYAFYFAVDMSPNSALDTPLYYDFVQVHIVN